MDTQLYKPTSASNKKTSYTFYTSTNLRTPDFSPINSVLKVISETTVLINNYKLIFHSLRNNPNYTSFSEEKNGYLFKN